MAGIKKDKGMETGAPEDMVVNCLKNKKVTVKFITKTTNFITDPRAPGYKGLADNCTVTYVAPRLASNGSYVNVLTDDEKKCLENVLGMDPNALSVYKKDDNYWDTACVTLDNGERVLDLSDPADYIAYKILLANKNAVARSHRELEDNYKETFRYVLIEEGDEERSQLADLEAHTKAYMLLGRYMEDRDALTYFMERMDGRPVSERVSRQTLLANLNKLIKADAKGFLTYAEDSLLDAKILLRRCVHAKLIIKKHMLDGDQYFLATDNSPLCADGGEPVFNVAAAFIADVKNRDLKASLEDKLKNMR